LEPRGDFLAALSTSPGALRRTCLEGRLRLIVEVEPFKAAERLTRFSMGQHGTTGGAQAMTRHAGSP
jgi:hypothetical protein